MMKKFSLIIAALLGLGTMLPLAAQSYQGLTMRQCIELARKQSLALKQQELERQNKELSLQSTKHQFLPSVSAGVSNSYSFGRSQDKTGVMVDRSSTNASLGINASIDLFTGTRRLHDVKAQKLGLEAATARLDKAREDLDLRVANLFISFLFQQEAIAVVEAQIKNTESQLEMTQEMVSAGKWPEGKILEIEAQLSKEKQQLLEQQNAMQLARLDLAQALEIDEPERLSISAPSVDNLLAESLATLYNPNEIYQASLGLRPAILADSLAIRESEEQLASAKTGYLPSLSLNGGYSNGYYYNFGKENEALNQPFGDQWKNNGRYSVGLTLSIPIFNAFQTQDRVKASRLQIANARLQLEQQKKSLFKEITLAYQNAHAAQQQIAATGASVVSTAKAYAYAKERFEIGKINPYELFEANTRYTNSRLDELKAKYDFIYKSAVLNFYRGEALY